MNSLYTKPFYKLFTSWNVLYVRVSIIRVGIELFFFIKKNTVYTLSRSSLDTVTFHPVYAADKRYRKSRNVGIAVFS